MHFSLFPPVDDRRTVGNGFMESKYNNSQVLNYTQKNDIKKAFKVEMSWVGWISWAQVPTDILIRNR